MVISRIRGDSLRRVIQLMLLVMPFLFHVSVAQSSGVGSIVTSSRFAQIFPNRNSFYTYNSFISAASSFPAFGTTGDSAVQRREIAAFFAHVFHETTGLKYIKEINPPSNYCQASTQYPCASGKRYYGRGPLQISWNYNYGPAGQRIGQNLLSNPDLVEQDPIVSFKAALWFWTTVQSPKPSCHNVMVGQWSPSATDVAAGRQPGFGVTIDVINGQYECGSGTANAAASSRVSSYQSICSTFGVAPGSNLACTNMKPF